MVAMIVITGWAIRKTLIDQGSGANILYWYVFEKICISHNLIQPHEKPMIGFLGDCVHTRGKVDMLTTFGSNKFSQSLMVPYELVDADTSYNVLLKRPFLNIIGAIISTMHLTMIFPSLTGEIIVIKANQVDVRECYVKSCKIELYSVREDVSKASTSSVNAFISALEDLDPCVDFEDR